MATNPSSGRPAVALVSAFGSDTLGAGAARVRRLHGYLAAAGFPCRYAPLRRPRVAIPGVRMPVPVARFGWRLGLEGDVRPVVGVRAVPAFASVVEDVALVSVPPFSLVVAAALAVPPRGRLVIDYRDAWSARATRPAAGRLGHLLERWAGRHVDAVSFAGHPHLGTLLSEVLRVPPERIVWLPNGIPPNELPVPRPTPATGSRPLRLLLPSYLYGPHDPTELAAALEAVGPRIATLDVLGHQPPYVRRTLGRLPSVRLLPPVPHGELLAQVSAADAVVCIVPASSPIETRIPAKLYDSLAVGTPVLLIAPADSAAGSVPHGGLVHCCQDADDLASLLLAAAIDRRHLGPRQPVEVDPTPSMRRLADLLCHL